MLAKMSQLDTLNTRSLSGVPMRPKPPKKERPVEEVVAEAISKLSAALAESHTKLASAVETALTCKTVAAPAVKAPVEFSLQRGLDGCIERGQVTCGAATWSVSVSRAGGEVSISATRI